MTTQKPQRIQQLDPLVANQIAAGEVVERPVSVVKELLENSLDAGARHVTIDLERGGTQLIRIMDDGRGIHADDLSLAVSAHATSKIADLTDLAQVRSFGFRGEALASISAVSRFTLTSRTAEQERAWQIQVSGRDSEASIAPAPHGVGTTIAVQDLFFNTPARRKFLRSERTELAHIEETIKRIALSRFDVGFTVHHHKQRLLHLRAAEQQDQSAQEQRVAAVWGKTFMQHALAFEVSSGGVRLGGWVGLPEAARSQADRQYLYINGRWVRDKVVSHAVRQAYGDRIYAGRHPSYLLYLELSPEDVDVNVHPAKQEVRFHEARQIHDFVLSRLQEVLAHQTMPLMVTADADEVGTPVQTQRPAKSFPKGPWEMEPAQTTVMQEAASHYAQDIAPSREKKTTAQAKKQSENLLTQPTRIAQWPGHFLLAEFKAQWLLVDLVQTHQAHVVQQLQTALNVQGSVPTLPLLFPATLTLSETLIQTATAHHERLNVLGFGIDMLGPDTLAIRSMPAPLVELAAETAVTCALQHLPADPKIICAALADLSAQMLRKTKKPLSTEQVDALLTDIAQDLHEKPSANAGCNKRWRLLAPADLLQLLQ